MQQDQFQSGDNSMELSQGKDVSALDAKMLDAMTPGFVVECDPEEAAMAGAFTEDALSEEDAAESTPDLVNAFTPAVVGTTARAWRVQA